ncbi:type II toxin-antitoxin system RelE/ParE family toxin [Neorhizobium alkalisoli]|uniref:type II toxin-antitoxin system RelE/ParE family toxin n=1 Tax=Neorhizobium alkalisoli TaxID=528178 RepID=UPI000CF84D00|nr:type II toxin-antitoxin system RelE/ParE family toxin [Neorhizobium alkalisoli]
MKKVRVSIMAADYIRQERIYLSKFSAPAARELSRKLRNAQSLLARRPEMGKVKPASNGVRILVVAPYVIEYEADSDGILILIIKHGRQDDRHDEDEDVYNN